MGSRPSEKQATSKSQSKKNPVNNSDRVFLCISFTELVSGRVLIQQAANEGNQALDYLISFLLAQRQRGQ